MQFTAKKEEYTPEDFSFALETSLIVRGFSRIKGKSFSIGKFLPNERKNRDQVTIQNQIPFLLLPPFDTAAYFLFRDVASESKYESFFELLKKELLLAIQWKSQANLIIPLCANANHWSILEIQFISHRKIIIRHICDPQNCNIPPECDNFIETIKREIGNKYHEYQLQTQNIPAICVEENATGVWCIEHLIFIITEATCTIPTTAEQIEQMRSKQIEIAFNSQFHFSVDDPKANEKYYTKLNFLGRTTNLTRSAILNALLFKLEPLQNAGKLNFSKTLFVMIQHLIPQTVQLVKAMLFYEAEPKNIFLLGKPYSTEVGVFDALNKFGITIIENNMQRYKETKPFSTLFTEEVAQLWDNAIKSNASFDRIIILDDGCKAVLHALSLLNDKKSSFFPHVEENKIPIIAIEQTTNGLDVYCTELMKDRTEKKALPVIMMASSVAKNIVEAELIAIQNIEKMDRIFPPQDKKNKAKENNSNVAENAENESNYNIREIRQLISTINDPTINIGVVGYGKIGSGILEHLLQHNNKTEGKKYKVGVYEKSTQSRAGIPKQRDIKQYENLDELLKNSHVIIGCTGRDIFDDEKNIDEHIKNFKNTTIFISCSSGNVEFFSLLKQHKNCVKNFGDNITIEHPKKTIIACGDNITIDPTKKTIIAFGGYPLNFSGHMPGIYFQHIQGTLALLFGGLVQAHLLIDEDPGFKKVPNIANNYDSINDYFITYNWQLQREIVKILFTLENDFLKFVDKQKLEFGAHELEIRENSRFRYTEKNGKEQSYAKKVLGKDCSISAITEIFNREEMDNQWIMQLSCLKQNAAIVSNRKQSQPIAQKPLFLWHVPHHTNNDFVVERAKLKDTIKNKLDNCGYVLLSDQTGKGGVGKTFLATEIAHSYSNDHSVFWFNAEHEPLLYLEYEQFCMQILNHKTSGIHDKKIMSLVKKYFENYGHDNSNKILIIYDNAHDAVVLEKYLPEKNVKILVTSRTNLHKDADRNLQIPPLSDEEFQSANTTLSYDLGKMLGMLPLTLSLASTYIKNVGENFSEDQYKKELENRAKGNVDKSENHRYFAAAWQLNFDLICEKIKADTTDGKSKLFYILIACAFLNPEAIQIQVLEILLEKITNTKPDTENITEKIIRLLQDFSLISSTPGTIYMHRLVQKNIRDYFLKTYADKKDDSNDTAIVVGTLIWIFYSKTAVSFNYYDKSAETIYKLDSLLPQLIPLLKNFSELHCHMHVGNFFEDLHAMIRGTNDAGTLPVLSMAIRTYTKVASFFNGTARNENAAKYLLNAGFDMINLLERNIEEPKRYIYGNRANLFSTYLNLFDDKNVKQLSTLSYFSHLEYLQFQCEKMAFGENFITPFSDKLYYDFASIYLLLFPTGTISAFINEQAKNLIEKYKNLLNKKFNFSDIQHTLDGSSFDLDQVFLVEKSKERKENWRERFYFETYISIAELNMLINNFEEARLYLKYALCIDDCTNNKADCAEFKTSENAKLAQMGFKTIDSEDAAIGYLLLGRLEALAGDKHNLALKYLCRAYTNCKQISFNEPLIAISAYCYVLALLDKGNHDTLAKIYIDEAKKIADFFGIPELQNRFANHRAILTTSEYKNDRFFLDNFIKCNATLFHQQKNTSQSLSHNKNGVTPEAIFSIIKKY